MQNGETASGAGRLLLGNRLGSRNRIRWWAVRHAGDPAQEVSIWAGLLWDRCR